VLNRRHEKDFFTKSQGGFFTKTDNHNFLRPSGYPKWNFTFRGWRRGLCQVCIFNCTSPFRWKTVSRRRKKIHQHEGL